LAASVSGAFRTPPASSEELLQTTPTPFNFLSKPLSTPSSFTTEALYLPRFRPRPTPPSDRRFTSRQQERYPGISREEWASSQQEQYEKELRDWTVKKEAHKERLDREARTLGISAEELEKLHTHHYGSSPEEEEPIIMAARAGDKSQNYINLVQGMSFDGIGDVQTFFRQMDMIMSKLVAVDPDFSPDMMEIYLWNALKSPSVAPKRGPDGESFVNPRVYLERLPAADIDSYPKIKEKLLEKFRKKADGIPEVINRLRLIERGGRPLREYADEFLLEQENVQIPDYSLVDIFVKQLPGRVADQLVVHMPGYLSKPFKEVRDWCVDYDTAVRNNPTLTARTASHNDRERILAEKVARLERENNEMREHNRHLIDGSKRWANSEEALRKDTTSGKILYDYSKKPAEYGKRNSTVCWNCWAPDHHADTCPEPRRDWRQREDLRIAKGAPANPAFSKAYERAVKNARALLVSPSMPESVLLLRHASEPETDIWGHNLDTGVISTSTLEPETQPFVANISDKASGTSPEKEEEKSGSIRHACPIRLPDTVYPEPWERGKRSAGNSTPIELPPSLRKVKIPVPLQELIRDSPKFRSQLKAYLQAQPESDAIEDPVEAMDDVRGASEDDDSDGGSTADENEDQLRRRNPPRQGRPKGRMYAGETYLSLDRIGRRLRNMTTEELEKYVRQKTTYSPAFKLAGWIGGHLMQDILVDPGAECNLIDEGSAQKILRKNKRLELHTDRNEMTITGVAGKTNISGYLIVTIDLGQGVIMEDFVYVVTNVLTGKKMLLGKPFLAMIGATVDARHDFLLVPTATGTPAVIEGRRYLGNRQWEEKLDLKPSEVSLLDEETVESHAIAYAVSRLRSPGATTIQKTDEEQSMYLHPWINWDDSLDVGAIHLRLESWCGSIQCGGSDFVKHLVPTLSDLGSCSVEGSGPVGGSHALGTQLFAGYSQQSAAEEGLVPFPVDDVTWWVDRDGLSPDQIDRLVRILRDIRPWVALDVSEMRHCSRDLIQHHLHPKPDAKWKRWRGRKSFSPKEMEFIRRYCGNLLAATPPLISPVEEAVQTSPVTLGRKQNGDYRFCCGYVYLNAQCIPQIWEIPNLDEVLTTLAGHRRYSGIDGFSGFFAIPMGEGRELTAFTIPGYGVFVWNYLPFGLQGGPSTYSKLMWKLCHTLVDSNFQVYLDNLEIGTGKTEICKASLRPYSDAEAVDAHLDQLEFRVLPIFKKANMSINSNKSPLLSRQKKTLGHVLSRHGVSKSPELVSKFKSLLRAPIEKPEQVERIFACLRYLSRYIPNLAGNAKFLSDKLRGWRTYADPPPGVVLPKGRKKIARYNPDYNFRWNVEDVKKLAMLAQELDSEMVLQNLRPGFPVVAIVDASPYAIACVLGQLQGSDGSEGECGRLLEARPVVFLSRVLDDVQTRWSQPEKEAFAVYWFVTQNRSLLLGSRIFVYCDCKPVTEAFRMASVNSKINRWILKLQEFDYEIYHIPGKQNILADSLSRVPKDLLVAMEEEEKRLVREFHTPSPVRLTFPVNFSSLGPMALENWVRWRTTWFATLKMEVSQGI